MTFLAYQLCGNPCLSRFWAIWSNLHVVDNDTIPASGGPSRNIKPVVDILSRTFLKHYCPGQELSVDECMGKYKGYCRGKVRMPNKPVIRSGAAPVLVGTCVRFRSTMADQ